MAAPRKGAEVDPNHPMEGEVPRIVGPPQPEHKMETIEYAVGKTISAVEFGEVEAIPNWTHEGEAIVLHFTDGTALSVEIGSNAKNLSGDHRDFRPEEFHTDLIVFWRDRRAPS